MMDVQRSDKAKQRKQMPSRSHHSGPSPLPQASESRMTPAGILQLQKAYGNRAVQQFLHAKIAPPIQRRLTIGNEKTPVERTDLKDLEMEELKQKLGLSDQVAEMLRRMAQDGFNFRFDSWEDAARWAASQIPGATSDSLSLQGFLNTDNRMEEDTDSLTGTPFQNGQSFKGEQPVSMPFEMVGDLGERLIVEWVSSWGVRPHAVKNNSGHGLDVLFFISAEEIMKLRPEVKEIFSSLIRGSKQEWAQHLSFNEKFIVAFEVKVNGSQLSKAQKNSDQYLYDKSKADYGEELREAIDGGRHPELFYLANVRLTREDPSKAYFDVSRRDDESNLGIPSNPDSFEEESDVPYSYMNSTEIGDAGEKFAWNVLVENGYTSIGSLQNDSGHGVDLVALDPSGRVAYFEVKTHYGGDKAPKLTARERKQSEFVGEILWKIYNGTKPYQNVPYEVREKAIEIINEMLGQDQEDRENRGEHPVANDGVNYMQVVAKYLNDQAVYHILDVTFPALGETGVPLAKVMDWKKSVKKTSKK